MRDPAFTSYLPMLLIVRSDLITALNGTHAYEAASLRHEWTAGDVAEEQRRAVETITARVGVAYNRLDLGPTDREKMAKEIKRLRNEVQARDEIIARLEDRLKHADAALVRMLAA